MSTQEEAAAQYLPVPLPVQQQDMTGGSATENKWSKNGYGEPCSRQGGKFTREETDLVRRAVEEFCALKNISTARLCSECDHKAELKGAWMEIAKRLPHRTVQSVYRHGLRQLHPFKRGPWTEPECQSLVDLVNRMGKKWSAIQAKLNRSADSCRDKYREMNSEYVKGRWKEGETEILKRLIREHLRADPNADIKELGKLVEREGIIIPWSTISKRMTKRSRLSCFKKWQKMTGIYSPSEQHRSLERPIMGAEDQKQVATLVETGTPVTHTEAVVHDTVGVVPADVVATEAHAAVKQVQVANPIELLTTATVTVPTPVGHVVVEGDAKMASIAAETVEAVDLPTLDNLTKRDSTTEV